MRLSRNPFRIRAAEHATSDDAFVRLFAPNVLDVLRSRQGLWDRPVIFRSAPGGGKTSLFRLFTPNALLSVYASKTQDHCEDTYKALKELSVLTDDGPTLLTVRLPDGSAYTGLADIQGANPLRVFFALVNVHLVLGALRSICSLRRLRYPADLADIRIEPGAVQPEMSDQYPVHEFGLAMYEWASETERRIYDIIDSLVPVREPKVRLADGLWGLKWLANTKFIHGREPLSLRPLVLLDDVQSLARPQRTALLDTVMTGRAGVAVWLAERFEALRQDTLISTGAIEGRDYDGVVELENYWRTSKGNPFLKFVTIIANKRVQDARGTTEFSSFDACLGGSLEDIRWRDPLLRIVAVLEERVRKSHGTNSKYSRWIEEFAKLDASALQRAVSWRSLEILIAREEGKKQQSLFSDPLPEEELEAKADGSLSSVAQFFLGQEFGLPTYFGMEDLARSAASNAEQFLDFAGELFEEVLAHVLVDMKKDVPIERQEEALKQAVQRRWRSMLQQLPDARSVQNLIEGMGAFAREVTYRPNAPYMPGVTGIGLAAQDSDNLRNPRFLEKHPEFKDLADILSTCLAYNLLEAREGAKAKNKSWTVLYLNRMLCVQFGLPLGYGGWNSVSLATLRAWALEGSKAAAGRSRKQGKTSSRGK